MHRSLPTLRHYIQHLLVRGMALDTKGLFTIQPSVIGVVGTLGSMTTRTSHHLAGTRVEDFIADGMGEHPMLPMAFAAHVIDRRLGHGRVVGTVGCMAVVAGRRPLVAVFCLVVPPESLFVTLAADMAFLPLEQTLVVAGMRGMAGGAAVIFEPNQMIVR